ncbi:MAG: metal-dependent transcriptional regulator [Actinobacteria bacterium]|nr:metal-dependent transcriptional regulator [Actinomycetota bacterium]
MSDNLRKIHRIKGRCETQNEVDELLEKLWSEYEERGEDLRPDHTLKLDIPEKVLKKAIDLGYLEEKEDTLSLTQSGYERARQLIRSHRLAERLLADILDFSEDETENEACRYEHLLDEYAIDSVCSLLGHPRTCPHGKKIPEGRCCTEVEIRYRPLVVPLTELTPGEEAEVKYLGTVDSSRLSHLTSFGFTPGQKIYLVRKRPAYVVKIDETMVGLDDEIARLIFVKPTRNIVAKVSRRNRFFRWKKSER